MECDDRWKLLLLTMPPSLFRITPGICFCSHLLLEIMAMDIFLYIASRSQGKCYEYVVIFTLEIALQS
jgi:hypothetical protein